MAKAYVQYKVFIGSPGGLGKERRCFRDLLERVTSIWAEPRGVTFLPVGWEDTLGGSGRPQALISKDLSRCDYAVFLLHDRWGSPTGSRYSSGTEEEFRLAERLLHRKKIRDLVLFFKKVERAKLARPDRHLEKVLEFKRSIENGKKYLYKEFSTPSIFSSYLEANLSQWLSDHESAERTVLVRRAKGWPPASQ